MSNAGIDLSQKADALTRLGNARETYGPAIAATQAPYLTPEAFAARGFTINHIDGSNLKQWWSVDGRIGVCMYPDLNDPKRAPILSFMQYQKGSYYKNNDYRCNETELRVELQWYMPKHQQLESIEHFDQLIAKMRSMLNTPADADFEYAANTHTDWSSVTL